MYKMMANSISTGEESNFKMMANSISTDEQDDGKQCFS